MKKVILCKEGTVGGVAEVEANESVMDFPEWREGISLLREQEKEWSCGA